MEASEAQEITQDTFEQENLMDDHLLHRDEEPEPEAERQEEVLTNEIERPKSEKRPRSKAQQEAFAKARKALAEKRVRQKEEETLKP